MALAKNRKTKQKNFVYFSEPEARWCSFSPQVNSKMPLVRLGVGLEREIALHWFVLQTQLQDQTIWSVLRTARKLRGENSHLISKKRC